MVFRVVSSHSIFRPLLIIRVPASHLSGSNFREDFEYPTRFIYGLYQVGNVALIVTRAIFCGDGRTIISPISKGLPIHASLFFLRGPTMFKLFHRRSTGNASYRLRSLSVLLLIVTSCIVSLPYPSLVSRRISDLTIIFRMRPITCVYPIAVGEGQFAFRGIFGGRECRLFQRVMQAVVIKAANSTSQRLVDFKMDLCGRVNAHLKYAMQAA